METLQDSLFSIIIPLYNRENYIIETLSSVKEQTYNNWECIIVDDGSNDNSYNIVEDFIKTNSRFQLYRRSSNFTSGGNGARNEGFIKSIGEFIIFLDSDDLIANDKLEVHIKSFISCPNVDISFNKWVTFTKEIILDADPGFTDNTIYDAGNILNYYGNKNSFIQTAAYCIKREFLTKTGLFLEPLQVNQDGEFFIRVLLHKPILHYSKDGILKWRLDTDNKSSHEINITKFKHRIASYKLIEQYRTLYDEPALDLIIVNAKEFMFNSYNDKCPNLISENEYFFRKQIGIDKRNRNLLYRIKNKVHAIVNPNEKT